MLFIFTIISLLTVISALPIGQSYCTFKVKKQYHVLNEQQITIHENVLLISTEHRHYEPFKTMVNQDAGTFTFDDQVLTLSSTGTLLTTHQSQIYQHPRHRTIFYIKDGILSHSGHDEFTACIVDDGLYSLHSSLSQSVPCEGKQQGIQIEVLDAMNKPVEDMEAPEFLYQTGELMFV